MQIFLEKGFRKEQGELFLKKVSFMENREYFTNKRKQSGIIEDDPADRKEGLKKHGSKNTNPMKAN
jgi:hypothetical protein